MRPAQKAPENCARRSGISRRFSDFNEAGAKSAGKHISDIPIDSIQIHFNEAGAKSAGKLFRVHVPKLKGYVLQ